jgi:8-oxo-dGTP pyrophosphatase MutT (NUDIX family)
VRDLEDDALATLTAWPGSDPMRQRFLDLLGGVPANGHLTASAVIVHPDLQRVLLCLHGRINRWVQVGGHCEPQDKTLLEAALREAREESGLDDLLAHPTPIDLDIHPVHCRFGESLHYDVRYAALAGSAQFALSEESHALGWFTADALPSPLASATERLIPLALKTFR